MDRFVSMHPNAEWQRASRVPFPSIAMHCAGNIGMSSMSCYDAAAVGLPSLMLCPTVQHGGACGSLFADLEKEGYVKKASVSVAGLERWLDDVEQLPPRLSNLNDEKSWDDALQWMLAKSRLSSRAKKPSAN